MGWVVLQFQWYYSVSSITVLVVSRCQWYYGGITVSVVSRCEWYHCVSGITMSVVLRSQWYYSVGGITVPTVQRGGRRLTVECGCHLHILWGHCPDPVVQQLQPALRRAVRLDSVQNRLQGTVNVACEDTQRRLKRLVCLRSVAKLEGRWPTCRLVTVSWQLLLHVAWAIETIWYWFNTKCFLMVMSYEI